MAYTRTKKLTDAAYTPTTPSSETDARNQLDGAIQEVYDMLAAITPGASGTDYINSAPISGVSGTTLYEMLANLKTQLDAVALGAVPDDSITDAKMSGAEGTVKTRLAAHEIDYTQHIDYAGTTGGSVNAYTISTPSISALAIGMGVSFKLHTDMTGASTLNWNGKGAKAIKNPSGTDFVNGKATGIYAVRYDGTNFVLQGGSASGNATASDILSGKTAATDAGDVTGTMPNRAGDTACLSSTISGTTLKLLASNGYRDGVDDYVTLVDADFIAANIKKDISIFGLTGSFDAKLYASGSLTTPASGDVVISGLAFAPAFLIWFIDGYSMRVWNFGCASRDDYSNYYGAIPEIQGGYSFKTDGGSESISEYYNGETPTITWGADSITIPNPSGSKTMRYYLFA